MTAHEHNVPRRASLELLRAEATDELSVLVHERLRAGEDPWDFMEDLPSVDELVVLILRAENIAADGGTRPTEARNYRVLRQIALDYPELTRAVWRLLGSEPHRRWDATVRAEAS
ncbi:MULTISPECIES: tryptophan synthase subunit alpha [unclassified Microbacterium]|uniref:tryptophan synthase subunit alpha n=1 Tax=unclassified Microbacterium TaxID=2609290 RepID=UPI00214C3D3B|nr:MULTISPECIES: tryptophan synthase subunit alpha [unclassified Microbacterium]MCR2783069.1 tryptophan synthase subunit alpha [Microbacterium sp. zg.B96]MDL5352146.1 tryptophan synthase subunit alpha [Microbacterium sp. zg-YB36]WIM16046.1 tryptophan synthase subunit alpha [Microbacterium sp. zg-B96]